MRRKVQRLIYILLGHLSLVLGVLGIFLPLLPTTPFILLAAFFFERGSERLHAWILAKPGIGNIIKEWDQNRVIKPKSKFLATVFIAIGIGYPVITRPMAIWIKIIMTIVGLSIITFILRQNSRANT